MRCQWGDQVRATDKFSLLISARMGVGHAGTPGWREIKTKGRAFRGRKEVVLQADVQFGRTIDDGQIFAKKIVVKSKRCW